MSYRTWYFYCNTLNSLIAYHIILQLISLSITILVTTSLLNHCLKSQLQPFILTFRPTPFQASITVNSFQRSPLKRRNKIHFYTIGSKPDLLSFKICFSNNHKRSTSLTMTWTWSSTISLTREKTNIECTEQRRQAQWRLAAGGCQRWLKKLIWIWINLNIIQIN